MKEQIKQALEEAANLNVYVVSVRTLSEIDGMLIGAVKRIEQLEKALEQIKSIKLDITSTQPHLLALSEAKSIARQALGKEE